jgi:hypothetical protein
MLSRAPLVKAGKTRAKIRKVSRVATYTFEALSLRFVSELKAKETRKPKKGEVADPVPYRESVPKVVVSPKITELPVMAAAPEEDKKSKASAAKVTSFAIAALTLQRIAHKHTPYHRLKRLQRKRYLGTLSSSASTTYAS